MARVPCDLADVLSAARSVLVTSGIFTAQQCYLTLDPDDGPSPGPAFPLAGVTFTAFDQRPDTVHAEMDDTDAPFMEGELVIVNWVRVPLDQPGIDAQTLTNAAVGTLPLLAKELTALNNVDLFDGSGNTLTARTLTFLGVRNRGRLKADKTVRRIDVRLSVAFFWKPSATTPALLDTTGNPILEP